MRQKQRDTREREKNKPSVYHAYDYTNFGWCSRNWATCTHNNNNYNDNKWQCLTRLRRSHTCDWGDFRKATWTASSLTKLRKKGFRFLGHCRRRWCLIIPFFVVMCVVRCVFSCCPCHSRSLWVIENSAENKLLNFADHIHSQSACVLRWILMKSHRIFTVHSTFFSRCNKTDNGMFCIFWFPLIWIPEELI